MAFGRVSRPLAGSVIKAAFDLQLIGANHKKTEFWCHNATAERLESVSGGTGS